MVPWLAEVSRMKIILFIYICAYVCIWMMDRTYGSWLSLSRHVCFLKILVTTCRIDKRKSHGFSFESFWLEEMNFWPWKEVIEIIDAIEPITISKLQLEFVVIY